MKNRRQFLKNVTIGSAAGACLTGHARGKVSAEETAGENSVRYRSLGSTGFRVSEIGFGAMNMRNPELVHAAIDSGINYIDTAHKYMNGTNEEIIGKVMKTKRDKVFLTTKIKSTVPEKMPEMIETSLRRLQTDHVDLLLLHNIEGKDHILRDDLVKVFDEARTKGQTRFVGFSSHSFPTDIIDAALEQKFWEAILVSYNYTSPPVVSQSIEKARKAGIAIIAMKSLMKGRNSAQAKDDLLTGETGDLTVQQALLRWVLENQYVDTIIPGMTAFEHLEEDVAIMNMKLSNTDRDLLRRHSENLHGLYCRGTSGCTECEGECPFGVSVKEINRCLGYAYGYGDVKLAHENYRSLPRFSRADRCSDCDECLVKCKHGLDLTANIKRARTLFT